MISAVYDQRDNPSLPKALVALISEKVRDILSLIESYDKKGRQAFRKFISKHGEALSFILQEYPEDFQKLQDLLGLNNVEKEVSSKSERL